MLERTVALEANTLPALVGGEPMATFSLREMLSAAFRRKSLMLLALILPPAIAVALIFILPPTYRAQTALMVKTGREYLAEGATSGTEAGPTITKLEEINSEMELLGDRSVIEATINRIGLKNLYPGILENPPRQGSVMDAAVKKFDANVSVKPVKMSNVLDVSFDYENDPDMATKVLDTYVATYLAKHAEVFTADRAHSFEESITHDVHELERLEQQQADLKLANRVYDMNAQRAALITQRVDAQTHLQESVDRQATLEQRIAYLTSIRGRVPATLVSTESGPSDEGVQANETMTELKQTESALLSRYAPENPDVQRVREQIAALQSRTREMRAASVKVSVAPNSLPQQVDQELVMDQAEIRPLADEITRYQGLLAGYGAELQRLEKADTDLRTVESRIDVLSDNLKSIRALYDVARTEDEMDAQRLTSVVQVAPALTPLKPAQPAHLLFAAGGLLLGIIAAGGVAVMAMVTRSVLFTVEGVESEVSLPVLAAIPMLPRSRRGRGAALRI